MPVYPISTTNLAAVANSSSHDPNKPIYMLNMWKYKQNAVYAPEHAHLSPEPCTGKEAADRYRAAIQPHLPPNASIFAIFDVLTEAAAPAGEKWDWVAVVRYETLDGFRKMVESKGYRENAEPHRLAALEEWRLIMMDKFEGGAPKEE